MLLLLLFPSNRQVLPEARLLAVGNVLRLSDVSCEQKRLYIGVQDDVDIIQCLLLRFLFYFCLNIFSLP